MRKYKKLSIFLILTLFCTLLLQTSIVLAGDNDFVVDGDYSEYYSRNEIIEVYDAWQDVLGVKTKMNKKLYFPDNSTVTSNYVKLTDVGDYTIEYSLGDTKKEYSFTVRPTGAGTFESVRDFNITGNFDSYDYMDEKSNGVLLTATESGAEIKYNGVISLDDENKMPSELTPLVDMCFLPKVAGVFEIGELYIKFTDFYDENKFIELKVVSGIKDGEPHNAYISATTDLGYEHIGRLDFGYRVAINTLGTGVKSSLAGKIEGKTARNFQVYYSTRENAIYCTPSIGSGLVLDFDDPDMVGAGNIWNGFNGKEVKLSISVPKAYSSEGSILIKSVGGFNLGGEYFAKIDGYKIGVDFVGYTEKTLPKGQKGGTYPVFKAFAFNNAVGVTERVNAQVFYKQDMSKVPIVAGRFTTEKTGEYVIRYTLDESISVGITKDVVVTVENGSSDLTYSSEYLIDGEQVNGHVSVAVGTALSVKNNGYFGGEGQKTFTSKVLFDDKELPYETIGEYNVYTLNEQGVYTISSYVYDFLGSKINGETVTVNASYNGVPVIDAISVPEYLVFGHKFKFDIPSAKIYSQDGVTAVDVELYVNGALSQDGVYTPTSAQDVVVKYKALNKELSYTVKVIGSSQPNSLDDYFYTKGGSATESKDGLVLTSSNEDLSVVFGKKVLADNFSISFKVKEGENNFENVVINLKDSVNPSIRSEIKIATVSVNSKKQLQLFVNDVFTGVLPGSFSDFVKITVNNKKGIIYDDYGNVVGSLKTFLSEYCYFSFAVNGVNGDLNILMDSFCSQPLDLLYDEYGLNDINEPLFALSEQMYSRVVKFGDKISLPSMYVFDIKNDEATGYLEVVAPNGTTVYSGTAENGYAFTISEQYGYGKYSVHYKAIDGLGNETDYMSNWYSLFVSDTEKPVIQISEKLLPKTEIIVGTEFEIPEYTVTDDMDTTIVSGIYITDENGAVKAIESGNYKFEKAGQFKLIYYAVDDNNNQENIIYTVIVKE